MQKKRSIYTREAGEEMTSPQCTWVCVNSGWPITKKQFLKKKPNQFCCLSGSNACAPMLAARGQPLSHNHSFVISTIKITKSIPVQEHIRFDFLRGKSFSKFFNADYNLYVNTFHFSKRNFLFSTFTNWTYCMHFTSTIKAGKESCFRWCFSLLWSKRGSRCHSFMSHKSWKVRKNFGI